MSTIDKSIGTGLFVATAGEHKDGFAFTGPILFEIVEFLQTLAGLLVVPLMFETTEEGGGACEKVSSLTAGGAQITLEEMVSLECDRSRGEVVSQLDQLPRHLVLLRGRCKHFRNGSIVDGMSWTGHRNPTNSPRRLTGRPCVGCRADSHCPRRRCGIQRAVRPQIRWKGRRERLVVSLGWYMTEGAAMMTGSVLW